MVTFKSSSGKASKSKPKMETLHQLLRRTIREGAPVYNEGNHKGCCEIYIMAAKHALTYSQKGSFISQALQEALKEAEVLIDVKHNYDQAAWVLRKAFDDVLEIHEDGGNLTTNDRNSLYGTLSSKATKSEAALTLGGGSQLSEDRYDEWQDEQGENSSDLERAQNLSHIYAILLSSAYPKAHTRDSVEYRNTSEAKEIVEILVELGLATHRRAAFECIAKLVEAGFLNLVYMEGQDRDDEKTRKIDQASYLKLIYRYDEKYTGRPRAGLSLYEFATNYELEKRYSELHKKKSQMEQGSMDKITYLALGEFLEKLYDVEEGEEENDVDRTSSVHLPTGSTPLSLHHLKLQEEHHSMENHENLDDPKLVAKGIRLAVAMVQVEPCLVLEDRRYNLTTYPQCFIGADAVNMLVGKKIMPTREKAAKLLNKLLQVGFIEHVTGDHDFKDKKLFYNVVSRKRLQEKLDVGIKTDHVNDDIIAEHAIAERLRQFPKLSVPDILNSFYGCGDHNVEGGGEKCWDIVNLQVWSVYAQLDSCLFVCRRCSWNVLINKSLSLSSNYFRRNNMKRWGFGRRGDQDDDMVDKLSPMALAVDPNEWKMEDQDPEWRTPWGILAQIAIFDQVPRSAFRGTADAFKWDALAIRATKYAVEQGYFETAYKSTLNRFVLLLPLEHSESWDDQKQGVNLLLQMLSTVAIEDEDLSDYEIVKRLEFSKRLSTAFLEHAQVIAKFKRYPHRNKAHGRSASIEERVWLASDLVPRWAKSQQHTDEQEGNPKRNIIQVPVIPLKRLTRG